MAEKNFHKGDLVRCKATWKNESGTAIDPDVVVFKVKNPAGTTSTYTYGTDAEVVKSSTGIYYVDVDASTSGDWCVRAYSTGNGQGAVESRFIVQTSAF